MEITLPDPLPTPYDIADLPYFPPPLFERWWVLGLIAAFIISILAIYLHRRKRMVSRDRILPSLQGSLTHLLTLDSITKRDTALILAKIRRANRMGALPQADSVTPLCNLLEAQVFGSSFSPTETRRSIAALGELLTQRKAQ